MQPSPPATTRHPRHHPSPPVTTVSPPVTTRHPRHHPSPRCHHPSPPSPPVTTRHHPSPPVTTRHRAVTGRHLPQTRRPGPVNLLYSVRLIWRSPRNHSRVSTEHEQRKTSSCFVQHIQRTNISLQCLLRAEHSVAHQAIFKGPVEAVEANAIAQGLIPRQWSTGNWPRVENSHPDGVPLFANEAHPW